MPFIIAAGLFGFLAFWGFGAAFALRAFFGWNIPNLERAVVGSVIGFLVGCGGAFLFGINWSGASSKFGATVLIVPISLGFAGLGAAIAGLWGRFQLSSNPD